jgi:hypothetical protein
VNLFRDLFRKRAIEQALDDELRFSVELLTQEKINDGFPPSAARRQALMEIGGVEQVKEEVRAIWAGRLLEDFAKDVRFALRTLAKSLGFTAVAVLTLSLGFGANTAIFSIVYDFIFSPRPYPHEAQVVQLYTQDKKHPGNFRAFSYPTYTDLREESAVRAVFSGVLAHNMAMVSIGEGETSRRTAIALVSSNYFRTLEVPLLRGRAFLPEEETPGSAAPVVIASYVYWKNTGFDPQLLRGRAFTKIEAEAPGAPPVAIVDEALAKKLWPEGDALGQRIQWAERGTPTVAGGAGNGTMGVNDDIARRAQDPPSVEIVGIVPATR